MKKFIKTTVLSFTLLGAHFVNAQTTIYADAVLAVSNEYAVSDVSCTNGWAACRILGAPDVYPICGDHVNAWTYPCSQQREWIEIGFSTPLYVDTVRIYETYTSGAIDTVYLRDAQTGLWNTVYASPSTVGLTLCVVKDIFMATTSYKVDAVRLALDIYTAHCFPEIDAVALIGSAFGVGITEKNTSKTSIFPNPSNGKITVKTEGKGASIFTVFDVLGNNVFSKQLLHETDDVELNIPSGIYVSVIENNGEKITNKLIIQ